MEQVTELKKSRMRVKLSQRALAQIVGVTREAYARWESGKTEPSSEMVDRLAHALDVPASAIVPAPSLSVPLHHPLSPAEDDKLCAHVRLEFGKNLATDWVPIAKDEEFRLRTKMKQKGDEEFHALTSLYNRLLVWRWARVTRVIIVDEDYEFPRDIENKSRLLNDEWGLPLSVYCGMDAWLGAQDRLSSHEEIAALADSGDEALAAASEWIQKCGLTDKPDELFRELRYTRIHLLDGDTHAYEACPFDIDTIVDELDLDNERVRINEEAEEYDIFYNINQICLIDIPIVQLEQIQAHVHEEESRKP